ncbi:MAG: fibronectin type III domain-containing protein, partial [Clostridiaceae bacterium]|nr:fibronectin type III domain-containing protein [Clostridiaceae bacterium]
NSNLYGNHKVVLSGNGIQEVSLANQSFSFNILEITKSLMSGYKFNCSLPVWKELIETVPSEDIEAPKSPQNLVIVSKTGSSATMKWDESTDNLWVVGYEIFRNGEKIGVTSITGYTDEGLTTGVSYTYKVKAFDAVNNYSEFGEELSIIPVNPHIISVQPDDKAVIGGNLTESFTVKFKNNGSKEGYKLAAEISSDGDKWESLTSNIAGPYYINSEMLYFNIYCDVKAIDSGDYYLRYIVTDKTENSGSMVVVYNVDNTKPQTPQELNAVDDGNGNVMLSWSEALDNIKTIGYKLFCNGEYINTTANNSYKHGGVNPGKYTYQISSFDEVGNESEMSEAIEVVVEEIKPPFPPKNLAATSTTYNSVSIAWTPSDSNNTVIRYRVYNSDKLIDSTSQTQYTIKNLKPNTAYNFTVRAENDKVKISEPISITVETAPDDEAPSAPEGFNVKSKTGSSVMLSWSVSSDNVGVEGYEIYRSGEKIGTTDATTYKDSGLTANTTYEYTVKAYDKSGNISDSSRSINTIPTVPHITKVSPVDGIVLGGTSSLRMYVYFANAQNSDGSRGVFEYSTDEFNWTAIENNVKGPFLEDTDTLYFYCDWNLSAIPERTYAFRYKVYDAENNIDSKMCRYIVDRTAPKPPQNLTSIPGIEQVTLLWDLSLSDDVSRYNIYRSNSEDGKYKLVGSIDSKNKLSYTYTDKGLEIDTSYY